MAWRLHDFIHLDLTDTKLSDLKTCDNPLKMLDNILDYDNNERFIKNLSNYALKSIMKKQAIISTSTK